ncbi:MAG: stage 0 sporulation family protein [Dissulfurispiraceae bacterium]|jgi:cell fate regulator YaaT (PSP1 superfamily)|nr:stage 0 sporulation family protein [Dissulfurispiraceae bacterium]
MPDVVGIRFRTCGKIYDFDPADLVVKKGDRIVVESDFGLNIGTVVVERHEIEKPQRDIKKLLRMVSEDDLKAVEENKKLEEDARRFCLERVMARGLPMKLVGVESTLDRKRLVFYFTAEGRIDFRELVKDLAAKFKTRIEMRQIGVRDESKMLGGLGLCGRDLCCSTFLTSFDPVSIKMAKKQELVLNVGKLSGVCGRLMCCLRYEYDGDLAHVTVDEELPAEEDMLISELLDEEKTEGRTQRTDSRRQRTENRTQRTDTRKQNTEDRHHKPGDRQQAAEHRPQKTDSREQIAGNAQPAAAGQPGTDDKTKTQDKHKRRRHKFKKRKFKPQQ